eukprot:TRINITY_DN4208_c0_g7_i1.p1 TRINITY_DN4208_c0_g7~~TRINITY_DN4208_c0_g7_i1.p1  ORF type:complete len:1015 (+),score=169.79 TRINITY_DN4208_c0_g7_i1:220-3264(+)
MRGDRQNRAPHPSGRACGGAAPRPAGATPLRVLLASLLLIHTCGFPSVAAAAEPVQFYDVSYGDPVDANGAFFSKFSMCELSVNPSSPTKVFKPILTAGGAFECEANLWEALDEKKLFDSYRVVGFGIKDSACFYFLSRLCPTCAPATDNCLEVKGGTGSIARFVPDGGSTPPTAVYHGGSCLGTDIPAFKDIFDQVSPKKRCVLPTPTKGLPDATPQSYLYGAIPNCTGMESVDHLRVHLGDGSTDADCQAVSELSATQFDVRKVAVIAFQFDGVNCYVFLSVKDAETRQHLLWWNGPVVSLQYTARGGPAGAPYFTNAGSGGSVSLLKEDPAEVHPVCYVGEACLYPGRGVSCSLPAVSEGVIATTAPSIPVAQPLLRLDGRCLGSDLHGYDYLLFSNASDFTGCLAEAVRIAEASRRNSQSSHQLTIASAGLSVLGFEVFSADGGSSCKVILSNTSVTSFRGLDISQGGGGSGAASTALGSRDNTSYHCYTGEGCFYPTQWVGLPSGHAGGCQVDDAASDAAEISYYPCVNHRAYVDRKCLWDDSPPLLGTRWTFSPATPAPDTPSPSTPAPPDSSTAPSPKPEGTSFPPGDVLLDMTSPVCYCPPPVLGGGKEWVCSPRHTKGACYGEESTNLCDAGFTKCIPEGSEGVKTPQQSPGDACACGGDYSGGAEAGDAVLCKSAQVKGCELPFLNATCPAKFKICSINKLIRLAVHAPVMLGKLRSLLSDLLPGGVVTAAVELVSICPATECPNGECSPSMKVREEHCRVFPSKQPSLSTPGLILDPSDAWPAYVDFDLLLGEPNRSKAIKEILSAVDETQHGITVPCTEIQKQALAELNATDAETVLRPIRYARDGSEVRRHNHDGSSMWWSSNFWLIIVVAAALLLSAAVVVRKQVRFADIVNFAASRENIQHGMEGCYRRHDPRSRRRGRKKEEEISIDDMMTVNEMDECLLPSAPTSPQGVAGANHSGYAPPTGSPLMHLNIIPMGKCGASQRSRSLSSSNSSDIELAI